MAVVHEVSYIRFKVKLLHRKVFVVTDPLEGAWKPGQIAAMDALHNWALGFAELNQHMSDWLGLPTSDANALGQIVWAAQQDQPLSPAKLARRIGMTTGAATVLLNRLEAAHLIERSREQSDRRRVTLRPTPEARDKARSFTIASSEEIAATLRDIPDSQLLIAARVINRLTSAAHSANNRLSEMDQLKDLQ